MKAGEIRIGCSGWSYRHWQGNFYPRDLPMDRWLEYYAASFDTVELNASFYRLPQAETFAAWARRVPGNFLFAVKASRYLTHMKRLRQPARPLSRLWMRSSRLGPHLGPMLYQLPPRWPLDLDRLAAFLDAVPRDKPQAMEFRDASWYVPSVLQLLERGPVALCLHDMRGSASRPFPVGPLAYVRFHGPIRRYRGSYSPQLLTAWADRMVGWAGEGRPIYAYFNNDVGGHAVKDAERLRELVTGRL
jgi:uncharacterized protein YecE (DUF72 family)